MIRSTFAGFNMASLALSASQRAIDVAGQNISNINTQGYTRQRLDQISLNPTGPSIFSSQYDAKVGQGVMMTGVSQIRDPFLDIQYRTQLPKVGTADAMDSILAQIGQIFDETDKDAIAVQFNKIISALQNLGDPENTGTNSADTVVRSTFEVLLNTVHQNGNKVQEVYDELLKKLDENVVPQVNSYLKQIAELDVSIKNTQILGSPALELQDERNELIDALATYFPIEVSYEKKNMGGGIYVDLLNIDLRLADGQKIRIVEDDQYGEIGIARETVEGKDGTETTRIVEPVELFVTEAGENPKTYGGGESTMLDALPSEIQGYIDDIAQLNTKIVNTIAQITQLEADKQVAKNNAATQSEQAINKYLEDIADFNKQINAATDAKTITNLQKQRREAVKALRTYFPGGRLADDGTNISISDGNDDYYLVQGEDAGTVEIAKNGGDVTEPATLNITSAAAPNNTYAGVAAGSAVNDAITKAAEEYDELISAKENRLALAKNERADKLKGLEGYFPAGTITIDPNDAKHDGIIAVKAGDQDLIKADNSTSAVSVTQHNDGSVTLNVADSAAALESLTDAKKNVEDIIKLNDAIKNNNDKIAAIQQAATNAGAAAGVDKINSYIDTIAELNKQINAAEAANASSNTKIADLQQQIQDERAAAAPDESKIADLEQQLIKEKNAVESNNAKIAEFKEQRTQEADKLKTYFPAGALKLDETTGEVSVDGTARATSILVDANGNKGSVAVSKDADKNVTDPLTLEITGADSSEISTAAGTSVTRAVDAAKDDAAEEINNILKQNEELDKQRDDKLKALQDSGYFTDTITATKTPNDPNGMMTVKVGADDLIDANNKAAAITSTGNSTGEISAAALVIPESVANRSKVSINDNLDEGVLKGDLDMLNKAEIFDKDIANNVSATDTKGIQYYQNMLDTFINQLATEMNRLNAITEEKPVFENGAPVYETDEEGNTVMEPVLDKDGNPVMEQKLQDDGTGNMVPVTTSVWKTVQVPKLEKGEIIGWEGNNPIYEFKEVLDENGNPVMEDKRDANGDLVLEEVKEPVMVPKMQPKQKTETVVTEAPLFETTDGSSTFTATNIKISDKWMSNEIKINVQRDAQGEGNSSDNWNVERMINALSDKKFDFIDPQSGKVFSGTLYECYTSIQRIQSVERQATSTILDTHTQVLDQIADSKDSVSGVWMDEEVMSLMKYSQSYNAASRLMTVMDEILERLITQTGVCGR